MPRKKQEMPYLLAHKISSKYHCVPPNRDGQEALITLRGYRKLRGALLNQCSANQIYTVAEKILHEAYQRINGVSYRETIQVPQCRADYHARLYDMFNIPQDQRDSSESGYIHPNELEQILLD